VGVKFNSNGKLLLSGEYLVLKGAESLSIPTRFSQTLEVSNNASGKIKWESYDQNKKFGLI
jgi:mevalonate kinase